MPENNTEESQYELDENYTPLEIADKADGSGTTWSELVAELNKMNQQIAALTHNAGSWDSQNQTLKTSVEITVGGSAAAYQIYDLTPPDGYVLKGLLEAMPRFGGLIVGGFDIVESGFRLLVRNYSTVQSTSLIDVSLLCSKV